LDDGVEGLIERLHTEFRGVSGGGSRGE
jgi:hypothetical protein